jgi:hypothetical protein
MNNFISLKSGRIVTLGAIAFIRPIGGTAIQNQMRGIEIVFPSLAVDEKEGIESHLTIILSGNDAEEFQRQLGQRGIDISHLNEARKDLGRGVHAAIARITGATKPVLTKGKGKK